MSPGSTPFVWKVALPLCTTVVELDPDPVPVLAVESVKVDPE
jgi:hypothetical protein